MGLSASQTRFLALTAKKTDLEYQSQVLNSRRTQLATESTDAARAYSTGMANQVIRIAGDSVSVEDWEILNYSNLVSEGYQVIGADGASLDPSPYTVYAAGTTIDSMTYSMLPESKQVEGYCKRNEDGTYTLLRTISLADTSFKGMDLQTLLMSGQGQLVSQPFYDYLVAHGYGTGTYYDTAEDGTKTEVSYAKLLERWENNVDDCNTGYSLSTIDWRSDTTSTFKQTSYVEDDAQVQADYERRTAEIQAQDKKLELEIKNIETEHKAVETEMDAVKKVIDKNIENSFKTFG